VFAVSVVSLYLINIPRFAVDVKMTAVDVGVYGILFMQANTVGLLTKHLIQFTMTGIARRVAEKNQSGLLKDVCGAIAVVLCGGGCSWRFTVFWRLAAQTAVWCDLHAYLPAVLVILAGPLSTLELRCFTPR
jgi:hypothetical protein